MLVHVIVRDEFVEMQFDKMSVFILDMKHNSSVDMDPFNM